VNRPTESTPIASIGPLGMTVELPVSNPELEETLRRDRESLGRDALLWQRWVRYAGLLAVVVLALVLGERANRAMLVPVASVALAYVLCVALTAYGVFCVGLGGSAWAVWPGSWRRFRVGDRGV